MYHVDRSPVKCQLKNLFTLRKDLQIQSKQVLLQVECKTIILIVITNNGLSFKTKSSTAYSTIYLKFHSYFTVTVVVHFIIKRKLTSLSFTILIQILYEHIMYMVSIITISYKLQIHVMYLDL
jgi:hypothetical protein